MVTFNMKDRRIELGLSQGEVAEFVGVSDATISRWESGIIGNMGRDKIEKLADILRVSPLSIMGIEEEESPATRVLLQTLKGASEDEILQAVKIIEALRK